MIKKILIFLFPLLLGATPVYLEDYNKDVSILDAFDIGASFLNDPVMNEMRNSQSAIFKDERFFQAMDDGYYFVPTIKEILAQNGIPPQMLYLSLAESHFLVGAYSDASASGLWQFMPATGKLYGLKIDEFIDERRDLVKSTQAAARYLNNLHKLFGKWYLVAIAYNCGAGKLQKAIAEAGSDELSVLLDADKKYIPKESRLHIRKILSLAMMANNEEFLSSGNYEYILNRANASSLVSVNVAAGESLKRVASLISISQDELVKLNKHLKHSFVPPYIKEYKINIPYSKLSEFKQKYYKDNTKLIYAIHTVKKGENLAIIAQKYNVSANILKEFNELKNVKLSINQKISIPNMKLGDSTEQKNIKKGEKLALK